ncbi:hypothetical protein FRC04_010116, partial [Tulasnella sp. 424]
MPCVLLTAGGANDFVAVTILKQLLDKVCYVHSIGADLDIGYSRSHRLYALSTSSLVVYVFTDDSDFEEQ